MACLARATSPGFPAWLLVLSPPLGGTSLTLRADQDPQNGQKVSLLASVANSETHRKFQFPKTPVWGSYFILFHGQ